MKQVIALLRNEVAAYKLKAGEGTQSIFVQSLISHRNQKPRVDIQIGEVHAQMEAYSALDVARNIIDCCEAAFSDAFIYNFMREKLELTEQKSLLVIEQFRAYRSTLQQEFEQLQAEGLANEEPTRQD